MAISYDSKPYALKDKTERIVDSFSILEKPTQADLNRVKVEAQVQFRIEQYRAGAADIDEIELEAEKHDSARLAGHLEEACDPRPNKYCHAHAIVAGKHPEAVKLRAVLAWRKMRIDDPHNGCWLPRNTTAKRTCLHVCVTQYRIVVSTVLTIIFGLTHVLHWRVLPALKLLRIS